MILDQIRYDTCHKIKQGNIPSLSPGQLYDQQTPATDNPLIIHLVDLIFS